MRLLLTRPKEDSEKLALILAGLGHEAVVEPLLHIEDTGGIPSFTGVQAVLATSSNGVRALVRCGVADAARLLPLFAVGEATARTATEAGFSKVFSADGDVEDLARLVVKSVDATQGRLLHVSGHDRAGDLKGALDAAGFRVETAVLYKAVAATALSAAAIELLKAGGIDGVLLFSPRTADIYCRLIERHGLAAAAVKPVYFCLSAAVRRAVIARLAGSTAKVARAPTQAALLALLS